MLEKKRKVIQRLLDLCRDLDVKPNKRPSSIRKVKKVVKRLEAKPKKNKNKKLAQNKESVNGVVRRQKRKKIFYLKSVIKLANRISRIQACYVGEYLTYKKLEQAIVAARFISENNSNKKVLVKKYLKILRFVGLNVSGVDLLEKVNDYFLTNDLTISKPLIIKKEDNDMLIRQIIANQKALANKKKKSRKRSRKGKKPKVRSNWGSRCVTNRFVNSFGRDVDIKRVNVKKIVSLDKVERQFRKVAKLPSKETGINPAMMLGGNILFSQCFVSNSDGDAIMLSTIVLAWKKKILNDCFYKMSYYRQKEITDLFIRPEYAFAEKQLRHLLILFDDLLVLFSLPESFSSKPFPVLEVLKAISKADKPILEAVV